VIAPLLLAASFALTPQQAVLQIVPTEHGSVPHVVRTNVVGNVAVVYVKGGVMEGNAVDHAFLAGRYAPGWQPLEYLDNCTLIDRGFSPSAAASLLRGMPAFDSHQTCGRPQQFRDTGSSTDVLAIRRLARGPLIPYVAVAGNYAVSEWYGAGGGQTLYERQGPTWKTIKLGGGAVPVSTFRKYGVPLESMCALHVYDAKCPR
jgi:hypothetical protein